MNHVSVQIQGARPDCHCANVPSLSVRDGWSAIQSAKYPNAATKMSLASRARPCRTSHAPVMKPAILVAK